MKTHFRIIAASCIAVLLAPLGALAEETDTTTAMPPERAPSLGIRAKMTRSGEQKCAIERKTKGVEAWRKCRADRFAKRKTLLEERKKYLEQRRALRGIVKDQAGERAIKRPQQERKRLLENKKLSEARKVKLLKDFQEIYKPSTGIYKRRTSTDVERFRAWRAEAKQKQLSSRRERKKTRRGWLRLMRETK